VAVAAALSEDRLAGLDARFGRDGEAALEAALTEPRFGRVALVSSFGAESAVLLDMAAAVRRDVPVLFVETGWLFAETLAYAQALTARLGLRDVRWLKPDPVALEARDPRRLRWSYDPDGCCALRKVAPLARELEGFDSWISGRKGWQAATRAGLPLFEEQDGRLKINPLADWTPAQIAERMRARDLPAHPLVSEGFPSIGCSPCTSRVQPGEDPRAGRWRGWDKVECGIHESPADGSEPAF
jgi:phosphoadenosine phosphosulfate reductase